MFLYDELVKAVLRANAPMTLERIVANELRQWLDSPERAEMLAAQRYYAVKNDVLNRPRRIIGEGGRLVQAKNLADNRIPHAFLRELADQKTQYLLGKKWSVECADEGYLAELNGVFDGDFPALLRRTARDAVNKGIAWLYAYPQDGRLRFKRMEPEELLPVWGDADHTELCAMIRAYDVETYIAQQRRSVTHVEYWDEDGVRRWIYEGGALKSEYGPDAEISPMVTGPDGKGYNWERLPFIPLKYNDDEMPLLRSIKRLIDEYDRSRSDDANLLEDQPNGIVVLKNYDGQDLGEFRRNLAAFRAVKVTDQGGVEHLETVPDITASAAHKGGLRRDIYAFGRGVDTNANVGANASAEARQYLYAQLDLDCNQLEQGVQAALKSALWFVNALGSREGAPEVTFTFNRDVLINEAAAIDMCAGSQAIEGLTRETILSNHPWVKNAAAELAAYERQRTRDMAEMELFALPEQAGGGSG